MPKKLARRKICVYARKEYGMGLHACSINQQIEQKKCCKAGLWRLYLRDQRQGEDREREGNVTGFAAVSARLTDLSITLDI